MGIIKSVSLLVVLNLLDILTTFWGGFQNEGNPIAKTLLDLVGIVGTIIIIKGFVLGAFTLIAMWLRTRTAKAKYFHYMVHGGYILVILWNVFCIWSNT